MHVKTEILTNITTQGGETLQQQQRWERENGANRYNAWDEDILSPCNITETINMRTYENH